MDNKERKIRMKVQIDNEHGESFSKNIDLSGWVFYKEEDFISFKLVTVKGCQVVLITYVYITNKQNLIKLLNSCIDFWQGNDVKFIYFLEHRRIPNYVQKGFHQLGFTEIEEYRANQVWTYDFDSTNGFRNNDIIEYYI